MRIASLITYVQICTSTQKIMIMIMKNQLHIISWMIEHTMRKYLQFI